MKPLVFCDVDGVLVTLRSLRSLGPRRFDPECVKALNWLIKQARAEIVVSSTWRFMPGLQDIFIAEGVAAPIVGRTPDLSRCFPATYTRGLEIRAWLSAVDEPRPFVILDDDSDMGDLLPRLVRTSFEDGLTMLLAERALCLLRDGSGSAVPRRATP